MKKYFSMLVVFSLLFSATAFADWGDKGKQAKHEAKADYYEAKDDLKDTADDAGDHLKDAGEDVKASFKKATN